MARASSEKTAFVFAGGGSLGAVEVGMLKALVAAGVEADFAVGSSVGAINAAYFAADPSAAGVERLEGIWRALRRNDVFPITPFRSIFGLLTLVDHIIDPLPLRRLLERRLPMTRLEEAAIPCTVVATDVLSGMEIHFASGPAVEALLASTALPAVFPPVRIGERFLVDGGIANNTPISTAAELHAKRVIVLPTGFSCSLDAPPRGALAMALHALNLLIARQLVTDTERLGRKARLVVVPPLCPLGVTPIDFSRSAELIDRAEKETRRWLKGGGLEREGTPGELMAHVHIA
jgi:NTE family protein